MLKAAAASNAIYLDFEGVKRASPALLGLLLGSEGEQLEQLILDERLAPARVANRTRTRVAQLPDAIGELIALAEADDRRIVGWSYFDRDRLIEARPDLGRDIKARYVNALHVARPWRRTIHPDYPIEREDEHSPKHTLDQYARLAAYPDSSKLVDATPAKWIRHILKQLHATGGKYRQTTSETKRDWHRLLEYNSHDCLALRYIVLKAARQLESWHAYERTRLCVNDGGRRTCFMAGSKSGRLDALLGRHGAQRWAFITAWNPESEPLGRAANDRRQSALRKEVNALGYAALPGEGVGEDPAWTPEESLLILGISSREAVRLGGQFGQLAIVLGSRGEPSKLISCARAPSADARGQRHPVRV